jgi:hypothetical protein
MTAFRLWRKRTIPRVVVTATVEAFKCDNPNHTKGCGLGWRLIPSSEEEAHTWIASIGSDGLVLWQCRSTEGTSRETATKAMLDRLAEGVEIRWVQP